MTHSPTAAARVQDDAGTVGAPSLAPRPKRIEDTGISLPLLAELLAKQLLESGALRLADLAGCLALSGGIIEQIVTFLRREAQVQVVSGGDSSVGPRYELTERGRLYAVEARYRNSYTGPAPVPLENYRRVVAAQSVHSLKVDRQMLADAMTDIVIDEALLDRIGPALNSGRAIFIYGAAGTGKTFITRRLARVLGDGVLIPHAIAINDTIVRLFDPMIHRAAPNPAKDEELRLDQGYDPRYVRCLRPVVISGGELTLDMLEMQFDASTRSYTAPLQLKANNGLFIIDDLGRQRVSPAALFNRWIVPMEERVDYLNLGSGRQFGVPFDVVLVFSTNQNPATLADDAFLRRIGYKIEFGPLTPDEYQRIWSSVCQEYGIECDPSLVSFAIDQLHRQEHVPLLPCHPRDLLRMALDLAIYRNQSNRVDQTHFEGAWRNYFVSTDTAAANHAAASSHGGI